MTIFIYKPTSGDRVFASHESPEMFVFQWGNGTRHVVGGIHLAVRLAGSRLGRDLARRLITQVVDQHGGIGWDEQGAVSAVLSSQGVRVIIPLIQKIQRAICGLGVKEVGLDDLAPQLFIQGHATVGLDGQFYVGLPDVVEPIQIQRMAWQTVEDGKRLTIMTTGGDVTVPDHWVTKTSGPWGGALALPHESDGMLPDNDRCLRSSSDTDPW